MSNEERIKALFSATPAQLQAVDAALTGQAEPPRDRPHFKLLRMGEVCNLTGISRPTLWRAIKAGAVKRVEIRPGSFRIPEAELIRFTSGEEA
jgi:excisionase family DNA binding protein